MVTYFPILTLRELFDHSGGRRNVAMSGAQEARMSDYGMSPQQSVRKAFLQTSQGRKLLDKIYEECEIRHTGWKCIVGWAVKSTAF